MRVPAFLPLLAALALAVPGAASAKAPAHDPWWRHAVIYEVYPRSFADTNGDGVGDLNGITAHLDHLQRLGVDAIWIAPMFPSPQVDFGYDISDYRGVDPQFGTFADLDRLQAEAKRRGIRLILDMVLNHTSDRHAWFAESAASRTNAKADWYVWSDGVAADAPGLSAAQRLEIHDGRAPPNNWTSEFGGSAWAWVPARRQFYYHRFYRQQPDLNWRNPAVEHAMFDMMRFWLDRGIAGFRLDAVTTLFEDPALHDEPEAGGLDAFGLPKLRHVLTSDLPEEHAVMRRLRALVDRYPGDRVLIGETWVKDHAAMRQWYGGAAMNGIQLPMDTFLGFGGPTYTVDWFRPRLKASQAELGGALPLYVFDNHDTVRSIDKFADGVHDREIAKGIATILYASRAVALTYYGAEIGMRTRPPATREEVRDPIGVRGWPKEKGRDGERRPMPWTPGAQGGFSTRAATWLPVNPDLATVNVETERADPASLLRWTETLTALRHREPAPREGAMTVLDDTPPGVLAWTRPARAAKPVLVAINMGAEPRVLAIPGGRRISATLAATEATGAGAAVRLAPFGIWVGRLR